MAMTPPESQNVSMSDLQSRHQPRRSSASSFETLESYRGAPAPQHPNEASRESNEEEESPPVVRIEAYRDLSKKDVAALIINKMVGSGIFTGPYLALVYTQDKNVVIVLWALGFVYTVTSMVLYLEYVRDLPYTGGELIYLDHIIPRPRLLAYTMYAYYFVLIYTSSTNALQFGRQTLVAVDRKNLNDNYVNGDALRLIAICIISIICLMLYFSTAKSQLMNKVTAALKLLLLSAIVIAEGVYIHKHGAASDFSGPVKPLEGKSNWTRSLLTILFSFHGWENATLVAGEIPRYTVLRHGFMWAVFLVGTFYMVIIILFCYAFRWDTLQNAGQDYLAVVLGGSDAAKVAAAVIIAFSTAGSMISVSYTCVRVKQTIAWAGILPWSSIWRRSAPLRLKHSAINWLERRYPQQDERPSLRKGSPEGGIILHWLVTVFYICITGAVHPLTTAISFTGQLLVYGHFFVSVVVGPAFYWFRPGTAGRVPAPLWDAPDPPMWIYHGFTSWFAKALLGLVPFGVGIVVIVAEPVYPANRYALYVMISLIAVAILHWFAFVYPPTASKVYARTGFAMEQCVHGVDDCANIERQCDVCEDYNPPEEHRHAQEGYLNFNKLSVNKGRSSARFLYHVFGGSDTTVYPDVRLDSLDVWRFLSLRRPARRPMST